MKTQIDKIISDFVFFIETLDVMRDVTETVDGMQYLDAEIARMRACVEELEAPGKVSKAA